MQISVASGASGGSGGSSGGGSSTGTAPGNPLQDPEEDTWGFWGRVVNDWENWNKRKGPQLKVWYGSFLCIAAFLKKAS